MMKLNIWGGFWAIIPLLVLAYVSINSEADNEFVLFSLENEFWILNWWKIVAILLAINWIFFLVHSLIKKRFLWFVAILVFPTLIHPLYWWFKSEKDT